MRIDRKPKITKYISNRINLKNNNRFVLIIGSGPSKGARSPKLWNSAYRFFKKKIKMYPADVDENNLKEFCRYLKSDKNFLGSSVTIPYKEKIIKAEQDGRYVHFIQETIKKYGNLWFKDEIFIIEHQE